MGENFRWYIGVEERNAEVPSMIETGTHDVLVGIERIQKRADAGDLPQDRLAPRYEPFFMGFMAFTTNMCIYVLI